MRATTVIKICVASLVLFTSIDSNAEMARLDFKGTLTSDDPFFVSGNLSDIGVGDNIQGYFLINTDAPYETKYFGIQSTEYSQINPAPSTPVFVDGSVDVGNHTFSMSMINPPLYGSSSEVDSYQGYFQVFTQAASSAGAPHYLRLTAHVNSPTSPMLTLTDILQPFSLQNPSPGSAALGGMSIDYESNDGILLAYPSFDEITISIVPVPVPASAWLLGSALLVLCLGAGTRRMSRARQCSFLSPQLTLPA